MINSIEIYKDSGKRAGKAARQRDQGLATHESNWMRRAISLETPEVRKAAYSAWSDAYKAENCAPVSYFR